MEIVCDSFIIIRTIRLIDGSFYKAQALFEPYEANDNPKIQRNLFLKYCCTHGMTDVAEVVEIVRLKLPLAPSIFFTYLKYIAYVASLHQFSCGQVP